MEEGTGLLGNLGCCCEVGDNLSWSPGKDRSGHCPSTPGQTHLHVLKTPESLEAVARACPFFHDSPGPMRNTSLLHLTPVYSE